MNDKTSTPNPQATSEEPKKPSSGIAMETEVSTNDGRSVDTSENVIESEGKSVIANVETGDIDTKDRIDLTDDEKAELDAAAKDAEGEGDAKDDDSEKATEALPEFDAEKPEVIEAYDAKFKPNGKLSQEALTNDWAASLEKNGGDLDKASISEDTIKYLDSIGIDRDTVLRVQAAEVVRLKQERSDIHKLAGGEERLNEALKWGREGGYSEAQRDAFNKAYKGTDPVARADAVEALMARYGRINPVGRPARKTTQGAGNAQPSQQETATGYEDHTAWRKDFDEAQKMPPGPNRIKRLGEVRAKLKVSPWMKKGKK